MPSFTHFNILFWIYSFIVRYNLITSFEKILIQFKIEKYFCLIEHTVQIMQSLTINNYTGKQDIIFFISHPICLFSG